MRVGLISCNARAGDAIGNHVAEKFRFFHNLGADVRLFVGDTHHLHPAIPAGAAGPADERALDFLRSCDLAVVEFGQWYPALELLPSLARGKPKIVIDYHGITPPELWGPYRRGPLEEAVRRRGVVGFADAVLAHSRYARDELAAAGVPQERIFRIGYVVEPAAPGAADGGRRFRRRHGLDGATVLLYVGRLAANKQVPLLVEALAGLGDVRPPAHLCVVGDHGDLYRVEADKCLGAARRLGLEDRVHLLGPLVGPDLQAAYAAADLLVTASAWESFCIPLVEAMAHGVPVVAARNSAVPETVADAGLTFETGDAAGLASAVRRALERRHDAPPPERPRRVAVVATSAGSRGVSGAEESLRTVAEQLQAAGHLVDVFLAASVGGPARWDLPCRYRGKVPVHAFALQPGDPEARARLAADLAQSPDPLTRAEQRQYLDSLPSSPRLVEALRGRLPDFDAVVAGPYLSRVTRDVALLCRGRALVVPCFHDEPEAGLPLWRDAYAAAGGLLYHSEAERRLAREVLGYDHPNGPVVGTFLPPPRAAARPPKATEKVRYVVYCGRHTAEKNVPLLLDWLAGYQQSRPRRWHVVFLGAGNVPLPRVPWLTDLGLVPDATRRAVLAGASALLQLSCNESLSRAALEAWGLGVPVIGHAGCAVMADHVRESGGGAVVRDRAGLAQALDDLDRHPDAWRRAGARGREYVAARYGDERVFQGVLTRALAGVGRPLYGLLQENGRARALEFSRERYLARLSEVVEKVLEGPPHDPADRVEVRRRTAVRSVPAGRRSALVPVRVHNWGTLPAAADGPGRTVLCAAVADAATGETLGGPSRTPLPRLLAPGAGLAAAVRVAVPAGPGTYTVRLWAERADADGPAGAAGRPPAPEYTSTMQLRVGGDAPADPECCSALLEHTQAGLEEADRLQRLPDDYLDVTGGLLASVKRRLKGKLLHNFKVTYVDALSRQQSAFNRQILSAVRELVECCALLDHAVRQLREAPGRRRRRKRRPADRPGAAAAAGGPAGPDGPEGERQS